MAVIRSAESGQLIVLAEGWANIGLLGIEVTGAAKKIANL